MGSNSNSMKRELGLKEAVTILPQKGSERLGELHPIFCSRGYGYI
ncbi:MAG: hypothetical protein PWR06_2568 [Thermoanaerobacteraceae bacterium]|jgi:hypothetical protein|nr:hypothetical protein [Thermoanaerobacteraceae bacterium]MDN5301434.1 hypothetical protein [Thermoanaerobacteraceae bacterium]MDN5311203.1 hypothetical protein [Thermoanaerobacteraceae bacterium]